MALRVTTLKIVIKKTTYRMPKGFKNGRTGQYRGFTFRYEDKETLARQFIQR